MKLVMWPDEGKLGKCRCGHMLLVHREKLDLELDSRWMRSQGDQEIGRCLNRNCGCRFPEAV